MFTAISRARRHRAFFQVAAQVDTTTTTPFIVVSQTTKRYQF